MSDGISEKGEAVFESGLSVRQAHEIETGCSPESPCARCVSDAGGQQ